MNGRFVLDTNVVIALFQSDSSVLHRLDAASAVYVPAVVLGEIYYGAYKSQRPASNLDRIAQFTASCAVLVCDDNTAQHYGRIKNRLREIGRPIPENDIWIAAIAAQHDCAVASRDEHFHGMDEILAEAW